MKFWGLPVQCGRTYKQTVEHDYHISQAVLDTKTVAAEEIVEFQVEVDGGTFILCNLSVDHGILQVPLDYNFHKGENVTFSVNSMSDKALLHVIGYTVSGDKHPFTKESSNVVNPLTNLTNKKEKTSKKLSAKEVRRDESSVKDEKENEAPSAKNKLKKKTSTDKTSQTTETSKPKLLSLKALLKPLPESDEDDDEMYVPPEQEEDELLDFEDEEDDEEEEEEEVEDEDEDIEEEEEDAKSDDELNIEEIEEIEEDSNENKDDEVESKLVSKKKKKRARSPSSAGRTPNPNASKKPKVQDLSGSPILVEGSLKKNKKKQIRSDSSVENIEESTKKTPKQDVKSDSLSPSSTTKNKKKISVGGVILEDLVIGNGASVSSGKRVSVYYEGKLKTGKVFDKVKGGTPFKFRVGGGDVIKAWEIGLIGMKVGGKRRVISPPGMAYGKAGSPPDIPPNSILIFDIDLKSVN